MDRNDITTKTKPCAICDQPQQQRYRPFCSKRCADIDLNRWLTGQYSIPVEEEEQSEEDLHPQDLQTGRELN